jgi:hypothetical protein
MAIFSKKNSARRSEDQAKVILDESLGGKPAESAPDKEVAAAEAAAPASAAKEPSPSPSSTAEPGTTEPATSAANSEAERANVDHHDDVEPEPIETPPVVPIERRFGIDDAIQLMRSLPADPNSALVVRVVRVTLGAVNVSVEEIVEDAARKEARIKEDISVLEAKIVELEGQLGSLRREIAAHQADLKETVNVRERLHLADQYPGPKPPPTPISATLARLTSSKPISSS